jgi:hypothetical protein
LFETIETFVEFEDTLASATISNISGIDAGGKLHVDWYIKVGLRELLEREYPSVTSHPSNPT